MRKLIVLLVIGLVAASAGAAPASAGKKKKVIHEEFTAQAVPFPNYSSHTGTPLAGCAAGEEGVHKVTTAFTAPSTGEFSAELAGFTGDWDLYVYDSAGIKLAESINDQTAGAAAEESLTAPLKAKQEIQFIVCNWAGAPEASGFYMFVPKGAKVTAHAGH